MVAPNRYGINFADDATLDATGRVRVSEHFPVFDNKNIFGKNENQWAEVKNGAGASITHLPDESSVALTVGTVSGEYAIRQSLKYNSYAAGRSQLVSIAGVLGEAKENVTKRVGYFDNDNGLFFEQTSAGINVVVRSKATGSVVDTSTQQTGDNGWNIDRLDGSGPSGLTLDASKKQIFIIDFEWSGAGRIRFGFELNGFTVYCHEVKTANIGDVVFMSTPSLPVRYEIINTGTSASPTTLKEIASSISNEGGYSLGGYEFSASNGVVTRAVSTTRVPVLAIKLANTLGGKDNRRILKFEHLDFYANAVDMYYELVHVHAPSGLVGTFAPLTGGSGTEVSTDITAVTGVAEHVIKAGYVTSAAGNRATTESVNIQFVNAHSFLYQNYASDNSQMFVVYATSFGGAGDASATLEFIETE